MAELRQRLFEAMRNDIGVMAEHNDSEASLLAELNSADQDILEAYADTFLDQGVRIMASIITIIAELLRYGRQQQGGLWL